MVNNYQIEIQVRIMKCDDEGTTTPTRQRDGRFTYVLTEDQAVCIDACERAVLNTNFAAVREALVQHFSALSLERAQAVVQSSSEVHVKPYRVDGEARRIPFDAHYVERDGEVVYDTTPEVFAPLGPKEWYRTQGFKELAFVHGVVAGSYRQTGAWLNRVRHQEEGGTPLRTLWDNTEVEGRQLQAHMEQWAATTLAAHGFAPEGAPLEDATYRNQTMLTLPAEQVAAAIRECAPPPEWVAAMASNPVAYEDPAHSISVAIDDVGVKQQKAQRGCSVASASAQPAPEQHKRVHHTVARIAQGTSAYILTGCGIVNVLRLVLVSLLRNQLLGHNLVFFVDGQPPSTLRSSRPSPGSRHCRSSWTGII
jgi:hypothetical protein